MTASNQSLLNQARTSDLLNLTGLNQETGVATNIFGADGDPYVSTEAREMAAYVQSQKGLGEEIYDDDSMEELQAMMGSDS